MKVAALQMDLVWENREANYESARRLGAPTGADLILLPEMFSTGFSMDPKKTAEDPDGPTPRFLESLARETGAVVVGGYVRRAPSGMGLNTALSVGPDGAVLAEYAKTHLIATLGEDRAHEAGDAPVSFRVGDLVCTCFVCYDLRFPELFRLVADDHHLVLVMASWPNARQRHWDLLLQARAIENQLYVAGSNRTGEGGGLIFEGGSAIIDPLGTVLDRAGAGEGIALADVCASEVKRVRTDLPFLQDRRF